MKQKLIALSKEKGFKSKIILFDDYKSLSDTKYYLWMCELRLWMIENNGLDCSCIAGAHLKEWVAFVDHDSITEFETLYADSAISFDTLPQALEVALYEGLKLTKK